MVSKAPEGAGEPPEERRHQQKGIFVNTPAISGEKEQAAKKLTTLIYALHAAGILTGGLTAVVAIIMIYIKKDEVAGTFLESHFTWQKRTFWYGSLGVLGGSVIVSIASMAAAAIGAWIGNFLGTVIIFFAFLLWIVPFAVGIWWLYRLIKGYLNLNDNKPMYS